MSGRTTLPPVEAKELPLRRQAALSLYWALLLGGSVGAVLALHNVWFLNRYVQKGLSVFVLEIAAQRLALTVLALLVPLLLLWPGASLATRLAGAARPALTRIALVPAGAVFLAGGYWLNRSSWFPDFASAKGALATLLFGLLCLGLALTLYRLARERWPRLDARRPLGGLTSRWYSARLLPVLVLGFAGFGAFAAWRVSGQRPTGPNLLLLSIDTLRTDHLGCYGYRHPTSPAIDRLAGQGVRFEHAYAPKAMTWPSLTTMMTSLYPKTHGVRENQVPLEADYLTLAEILKNAGYQTAAFLANYYYSPNRGFDVKKGDEVGDLDNAMTRQAIQWLNRFDPSNRFFVWLHLKNPHIPYKPEKKYLELFESGYTGEYNGNGEMTDAVFVDKIALEERDLAHLMALYDAEVRSADTNLERVLAKLQERGLENDTLVVFVADHGEELYSHQNYFYHHCSIYDSVLRIPLILRLPGVLEAGKVIGQQVENVDLAPTILQLLKQPIPSVFEGRSFVPVLFGEVEDEPRPAFGERTEGIYSIRTPEWKYIYNPGNLTPECLEKRGNKSTPFVIRPEELYRVSEDPGETRNVVADHPEAAHLLRARLVEWAESNRRVHKQHQLSKEAEERLRALGYIN